MESAPGEVITGFLSIERLIATDIAGQAASTGKGMSEWLGGSRLSVSSGSKQMSPFQVSGSRSLSVNALSHEKLETEFNCCNSASCTVGFQEYQPYDYKK